MSDTQQTKLSHLAPDQEQKSYIQETINLIDTLLQHPPHGLRSYLLPCDINDLEKDKKTLLTMLKKESFNLPIVGNLLQDAQIIKENALSEQKSVISLNRAFCAASRIEAQLNRLDLEEQTGISKTLNHARIFMASAKPKTIENRARVEAITTELETVHFKGQQVLIRHNNSISQREPTVA